MSDRWTFGIHFGSDEILAKSIFSHLPDGTGTLGTQLSIGIGDLMLSPQPLMLPKK
jgi:hypothetical protein